VGRPGGPFASLKEFSKNSRKPLEWIMSEEIGRVLGTNNLRDALLISSETANRNRHELYEFGPFRLEPAERKLSRGDEVVTLTPKVFDMLVMLVRNNGHLLEKDELIRSLWPDSFVEEGNLSSNIFVLRKALGNDHEYIETVPRKGYRFVGAVRQLPSAERSASQPRDFGSTATGESEGPASIAVPSTVSRPRFRVALIAGTALVMLGIGAALWWHHSSRLPDRSQWIQVTRFPDSVAQPALSPDGRILAFIRGYSTWIGPGQIYVKILPDGQPVQLTRDDLFKMSPAFSSDGSRIAYTAVDPEFHWDTWVVPTLGGEPQPLMRNASGLTWTAPQQVLFSEIKMGIHMGIVAARENRIGARDIYLPETEPAMAHRSYVSPDGKWVLLVEMDEDHLWLPCHLVPMDGSMKGRYVGPLGGGCTMAAWTPDGKWMYFTSDHGGAPHVWRQRFPDGQPEQVTSGPTEEEGIAMAPDGRSFITAVAVENNSLWVRDARGERQVSLEGNANDPKFTPDGRKLCYLTVIKSPNQFAWYRNPGELQVADLASGRSEPLLPGFPVLEYDISPDGRMVVMSTTDTEGKSRLWVMPFDRSSPPVEIPNVEGASPKFGGKDIFFRHLDGKSEYVYRVHPDGTGVRKALKDPVILLWAVSPDGNWISALAALPGSAMNQAFPLDGKTPTQIGSTFVLTWSLDGRACVIKLYFGTTSSYLIPLRPGEMLPRIPAEGFHSEDEVAHLPGAHRIDAQGVVPALSPSVYAFYRNTVQRNLYRIPIP
jgi:DNA-binding winged helix-turn-helix (wHTH) protein/Tol biopolymer transport system component